MEFKQEYGEALALVERELSGCLQVENAPQKELLDAMRYSLLAGGKRVRPILTLKYCQAVCGSMDPALDYACGVEMLHTYSLIHDDLPCMDNDDLRRGKPTCHRVYGECNAVLAGDALQAEAFCRLAASQRSASLAANGRACAILGEAAGAISGICAGQYLDMAAEGKPQGLEELTRVHMWKTAALLKAACLLGLAASPTPADERQWSAAARYAEKLGLAFQIRDDMLDEESTTEALGKPVGSDAANGKVTFVTLYGAEECRRLVERYTCEAVESVRGAFRHPEFLCALARSLAERKN
jgi:geranylgeranyl pyrophosphate synthase